MRILVGMALCAALTGCMPLPTMPPPRSTDVSVPFNAAATQAALAPGHAIIKGQAFAKTVGGDVKYAAGNTVYLMPDDSYTFMCFLIVGNLTYQPDCFARLKPYVRETVADGQGQFEFDDVKPGKYRLETVITWGIPGMYGVETTGGIVQGTIEVKSDVDVATVYLK